MSREMTVQGFENELKERSEGKCELCSSTENLSVYEVPPTNGDPVADKCAYLCKTCLDQVTGEADIDENHWFCLNESAWSTVPAVQALALRLLNKISGDWAGSLADQLYLEDDVRAWAEEGMEGDDSVVTKDSNGTPLSDGDSVTIIKDLDVKGTSFVAKRGTVVKGIKLTGDGKLVEGKVNGTSIYLIAAFLKKM